MKIIDIDILSAFFYNESSKKEKEDFYGIRFELSIAKYILEVSVANL